MERQRTVWLMREQPGHWEDSSKLLSGAAEDQQR